MPEFSKKSIVAGRCIFFGLLDYDAMTAFGTSETRLRIFDFSSTLLSDLADFASGAPSIFSSIMSCSGTSLLSCSAASDFFSSSSMD